MRACNYGPEGNLAVSGLALLTFLFLRRYCYARISKALELTGKNRLPAKKDITEFDGVL